jgi:hypothetical protein
MCGSSESDFALAFNRLCLNTTSWTGFDPKAAFKVDPRNGREARESGPRLKASVAPRIVSPSESTVAEFSVGVALVLLYDK